MTGRKGHTADNVTLVGIGAALVALTNAVIFVLPPLLPVIAAEYELATLAQTTWLYTALTLGGAAGFILLPRLADVLAAVVAALVPVTLLFARVRGRRQVVVAS